MGNTASTASEDATHGRLLTLKASTLEALTQRVASNGTVPAADQVVTNNVVTGLMRGPKQIFGVIARLAREAKYTFDAISYEWDAKSDVAKLMMQGVKANLLARHRSSTRKHKAKARATTPLQVRFMTDHSAIYDKMNKQFKSTQIKESVNELLQFAKDHGLAHLLRIEARVWRHETLASNHSKYFIADIHEVVVTGNNIDAYYDWTRTIKNARGQKRLHTSWHDTGIAFKGPVARVLHDAFNGAWAKASVFAASKERPHPKSRAAAAPDAPRLKHSVPVLLASKGAYKINMSDVENPQDVSWLYLMAHAKRIIRVETPNINDAEFQTSILNALMMGTTVQLITGYKAGDDAQQKSFVGGGTNDQVIRRLQAWVAQRMPREDWGKLQVKWYSHDGKAPVVGYAPGASHTKYMSVDGNVFMMGSGNQDTQSWKHSRETNVVVFNAPTTASADSLFFAPDWKRGIVVEPAADVLTASYPRWYN